MTKPYILVTNDDGVFAPGIRHLWTAIKEMADVIVVAPAREQSATGLSITIRNPLDLQKVTWPSPEAQVWSVTGTPSDCIKMALNVVSKRRPSLIVSGINRGTNAGRNVLYSGTVAAVIEGTLQNIPGIAFSLGQYDDPCFLEAEKHIPTIVNYVLQHPLPSGTLLNVNFPEGNIKGIRMARQGKEYWAEDPECRTHPTGGHDYYWLGLKIAKFEEREDSDIALLEQGYATAVPLHVQELTDQAHILSHKLIFENFVNLPKII